jgi:hypothetical protein
MSQLSVRSLRRSLFVLFASALAGSVLACGSRTGLLAGVDDNAPADGALPPIGVTPPKGMTGCPDAAATVVYVVTTSNTLYSYLPPATLRRLGTIACPAAPGDQPFSMAVDRTGIAYVVFRPSGDLFRVSTATLTCRPTSFVPQQHNFATTFGMAFSSDTKDKGETLYVAGDMDPPQLARIDVGTFALTVIGDFQPSISQAELTGTGAGDLFGFWQAATSVDSAIVQIDKSSGRVTASSSLPGVSQGDAWAFAFWGGDFYTFTAPTTAANSVATTTVIHRYSPSDGSVTQVAQVNDVIVGAGVSTCAPGN